MDQDQDQEPVWWPVEPIRDMTAGQLAVVVAYLRTAACPDEVLIQAVQTELTFRHTGIHPHPTALAATKTNPHAATLEE